MEKRKETPEERSRFILFLKAIKQRERERINSSVFDEFTFEELLEITGNVEDVCRLRGFR